MESEDERRRRLRAERREFIRAHHPDVGGDPAAFDAGLRRLDPTRTSEAPRPSAAGPAPRLRVRRSNRPDRVLRRVLRRVADQRSGRPRRHLD